MNILLLVILSCISLFMLWLILRVWYGKRLRKDILRRKSEIEKLQKEIRHQREMRKHLGFHAMEREEFIPSLSEEEKELTEGQIQEKDRCIEMCSKNT